MTAGEVLAVKNRPPPMVSGGQKAILYGTSCSLKYIIGISASDLSNNLLTHDPVAARPRR